MHDQNGDRPRPDGSVVANSPEGGLPVTPETTPTPKEGGLYGKVLDAEKAAREGRQAINNEVLRIIRAEYALGQKIELMMPPLETDDNLLKRATTGIIEEDFYTGPNAEGDPTFRRIRFSERNYRSMGDVRLKGQDGTESTVHYERSSTRLIPENPEDTPILERRHKKDIALMIGHPDIPGLSLSTQYTDGLGLIDNTGNWVVNFDREPQEDAYKDGEVGQAAILRNSNPDSDLYQQVAKAGIVETMARIVDFANSAEIIPIEKPAESAPTMSVDQLQAQPLTPQTNTV